jgi:hypothetical protein
MTGDQCREARGRLNWTRSELAAATNVPLWFIAAFEDGKATPAFLILWPLTGPPLAACAIFGLVAKNELSVDSCEYWQRRHIVA